jgi:hypothetical protein
MHESESENATGCTIAQPVNSGSLGTRREKTSQRRAANSSKNSTVSSMVHEVLRSAGQPLNPATRAFMEPRFGHDFGQVRVHTDARAAESARAVNAVAYTAGRHVVFSAGVYSPEAAEGKRLLAHELTHVLQQYRAPSPENLTVGQPGDIYEQQADAVAKNIVQSKSSSTETGILTTSHGLQRFESPEHIELGDQSRGPAPDHIVLECHSRDLPQRSQPVSTWPATWQSFWGSATSDQQRAIVQGLTYGEVVAMAGDMYANFGALNRAPLREVINLIPLLRSRSTTTTQFQVATGGRYLALAEKNVGHFSNVPVGQRNRDIWRENHLAAIQAAKTGNANLAWGLNASGDHFLTDAFSGGHIRTPRAALSGKLGSIESKILHDLDNTYGVEVTNSRGDPPWIAYGDNLLDDPRNAQSRTYALEAVQLSKQDVADALTQGTSYPDPKPGAMFAAESLIPFPINPSVDRWTGRTPTYAAGPYGPVRQLDDYTMMRNRLVLAEGPGVLSGLLSDDDQVRAWVSATDLTALGRQPVEEKLRMINTLIGGVFSFISDDDLSAMIKILSSVTTDAEMRSLRAALQSRELDFTDLGQRTKFRLALYRNL